MSRDNRLPILVTGAHRSGTTWVGRMLAASGEATYISEPLNRWHRPGVLLVPVKRWYPYICIDNQAEYFPALRQMLELHYHTWAEVRSLHSLKDLLRMGRDVSAFTKGRLYRQRPLLKDPFAVYSAPWFAQVLDCQVVITVRHPAGFASSLKRLNWPFNFHDLLDQPLLMRDWLEPYREEMQAMLLQDDIIGQSALLWKTIYHAVACFQERYPQFQVVRHEDLSLEPVQGFHTLYAGLGLQFTPLVEQTILRSSSAENPAEASVSDLYATQINSRAGLYNWKRRLTSQEIERIYELTIDVAHQYYPEAEWE